MVPVVSYVREICDYVMRTKRSQKVILAGFEPGRYLIEAKHWAIWQGTALSQALVFPHLKTHGDAKTGNKGFQMCPALKTCGKILAGFGCDLKRWWPTVLICPELKESLECGTFSIETGKVPGKPGRISHAGPTSEISGPWTKTS